MRYQFIDRVVAFSPEPPMLTITKTFPPTDDCFTGPVPDAVPVSLLIETLAMAGGYLILRSKSPDRLPVLLKVEDAVVTDRVLPGETVTATVTLRGITGMEEPTVMAQTDGEVSVSGRPVLRSGLLFVCVRPSAPNLEMSLALLSSFLEKREG